MPAFFNSVEEIAVYGLVEVTVIVEDEGCLGTPDELYLDWEARKPIPGGLCAEDGSMNRRHLRSDHRGQEAGKRCSGREQNVQRPCVAEGWHGVFERGVPGRRVWNLRQEGPEPMTYSLYLKSMGNHEEPNKTG